MIFFYVFIQVKEGGGGCTNAFIYMGTHSQLQNRMMDFDETW